MWIGIIISICLVIIGVWLSARERIRSAIDVTRDVGATFEEISEFETQNTSKTSSVSPLLPLLAAACAVYIRLALMKSDIPGIVFPSLLAASAVYLIQKRILASKANSRIKEIEYFLPIVMERLVMAVESGLDIIPAIQVIVELEAKQQRDSKGYEIDPVTKLFTRVIRLANAGVSFDTALNEVAKDVPCPALKHAFIHLGVAFRDGGELIGPLRELSDATQAYFQESIEEEIAKMPVKATMPLVLTFAGLITFFIASPIVQIINFTAQAVPK